MKTTSNYELISCLLIVISLMLTGCQINQEKSLFTPEPDLTALESTLKLKLENYEVSQGVQSSFNSASDVKNIVFMMDLESGYGYSREYGLTEFNVYGESKDGTMKNRYGEVLKLPSLTPQAGATNLSSQAYSDQGPLAPIVIQKLLKEIGKE
jgi:hypothetical protein